MGEYAKTLRTEVLMTRLSGGRGGPSEDEARLAGARFVQANETSQGMRLNEALVNDLTGGDTITARRLYENSFEYRPHFKLWIRGNHKPVLLGSDGGIARRVKLIPFDVHIRRAERDPRLLEKLKAELPGILNWAVEGCLKWQHLGLEDPKVVRRATEAYLAEMDPIGCFINDCCTVDPALTDSTENLHRAYVEWSAANDARPLTVAQLSQRLTQRGLKAVRSRTLGKGAVTRGYAGIQVSAKCKV
jgi:putative DNA primase/helicase